MNIIEGRVDWKIGWGNAPEVYLLVDQFPPVKEPRRHYVAERNAFVGLFEGYADWLFGGNQYDVLADHPQHRFGDTCRVLRTPDGYSWKAMFNATMPEMAPDPQYLSPRNEGGLAGRIIPNWTLAGDPLYLHGPWIGCTSLLNPYLPEPIMEVCLTDSVAAYARGYTFSSGGVTVALLEDALARGVIDGGQASVEIVRWQRAKYDIQYQVSVPLATLPVGRSINLDVFKPQEVS